MDTLRDRQLLEDLVEKGDMPWIVNRERHGLRPKLRSVV
jgi:hypothetical protein